MKCWIFIYIVRLQVEFLNILLLMDKVELMFGQYHLK